MNLNPLATILIATTLVSCERAQKFLGDAADQALEADGKQKAFPKPGGDIQPDLAKLIERSDDGVTFRRDLDFPTQIDGAILIKTKLKNVRTVITSAIGREDETINEQTATEIEFSKSSGQFSLTTKRLGRPLIEQKEESDTPIKIKPKQKEDKTLQFITQSNQWTVRQNAKDSDLGLYMWADSLAPELQEILIHCGAYPRTQWFSSSRSWKKGDTLTLTGNSVKLINPFHATGRINLKFIGEEAIGGHPCGLFSVEGEISVKDQIDFEGQKHHAEITISEGKIWASLIHPILLREEYDTIQSINGGQNGGSQTRSQGNIHLAIQRDWQPQEK